MEASTPDASSLASFPAPSSTDDKPLPLAPHQPSPPTKSSAEDPATLNAGKGIDANESNKSSDDIESPENAANEKPLPFQELMKQRIKSPHNDPAADTTPSVKPQSDVPLQTPPQVLETIAQDMAHLVPVTPDDNKPAPSTPAPTVLLTADAPASTSSTESADAAAPAQQLPPAQQDRSDWGPAGGAARPLRR